MAPRTLIDTDILVCRYDGRFPDKQRVATGILRDGIATGSARIAHQSIVEFVAATTRGGPENRLLDAAAARREAEEFMAQFPILYPDASVLRTALRGAAHTACPGSMRISGPMLRSTGPRNCCPRISSMAACTARW